MRTKRPERRPDSDRIAFHNTVCLLLDRPSSGSHPVKPLSAVERPNVLGADDNEHVPTTSCASCLFGVAHPCAISDAAGQSRLTMAHCI